MTKDIYIAMDGLQFSEAESPGRVESINAGEYYLKNGKHYILYEELMEETDAPVKNMIKIGENFCSVSKKGAVNVNMLFEVGKSNISNYVTPFGMIVVGIDTHAIEIKEEENKIEVFIDYALAMNYEHLANCRLHMTINSAGT